MSNVPSGHLDQEYVWNYPSEKIYGILSFDGAGYSSWYSSLTDNVWEYSYAKERFDCSNPGSKLVEWCRHLADGKLVAFKVISIKK